ncbi:MAG TPA: ABC transporter substrate-binding protein, partial [Thermomicrobiales bacterium]|nr:ABC transporter substrate-binding protein [Thermomicrobiales bacterium]
MESRSRGQICLAPQRSIRLNRRRLIVGTGGVAASLALSSRALPAWPALAQAKQGGTLVSMLVAEPTSMDIAAGIGQHNYAIMSNVFENLLEYDDDTFAAKPCLAESYDVSPDGMVYTFHLRKGVVFHDGTPMNAQA